MSKETKNSELSENKALPIGGVVNWVAIGCMTSPDRYANVIARLKDGSEIKLEFECEDGFCDEAGTDYTNEIIEWRQV